MPDGQLRVLISKEQIQDRIGELGAKIAADYPESNGQLCLIGILKGAFIFLADLARAIPRQTRIDFIGISSYGRGKTTSGEVKVTKDLDTVCTTLYNSSQWVDQLACEAVLAKRE